MKRRYHPVVDGRKVCSCCNEEKPVSEFYPRGPNAVSPYCKPCRGQMNRESRARMQARGDDPTATERFWAKVRKTNGCWLWEGGKGYLGYGRFTFRGRLHPAHTVSLILSGVDVPSRWETGLVVDHICKVPSCVRPDHLRVVLQEDNCTTLAKGGPFKRNRHATHCVHGHEFTPENTYRPPSRPEFRGCKTCIREKALASYHKTKTLKRPAQSTDKGAA